MQSKERLLHTLLGKESDRLPWAPNVAYWWNEAPEELIKDGEVGFLESIGADCLIRGHYPMDGREWEHLFLFQIDEKKAGIEERINGTRKTIEYSSPSGSLRAGYVYSDLGDTWFLLDHPVKTEEDFKTLAAFYESLSFKENYGRWAGSVKEYGERALLVPLLVPFMKSSFQAMVEHWVGTEELIYALFDYPETVEHTLSIMKEKHLEAVKISAASGAEVFTSWEDTSTTNISPGYYKEYIKPEIDEWCSLIHDAGAIYLQHACGTLKHILPEMGTSRIDGIESISPPPTGNIELWDAREYLRPEQSLVGGIEPTVFLNSSIEELKRYTERLVDKLNGSRFVLANSDSCPPGVEIEKFKLVSDLVKTMV